MKTLIKTTLMTMFTTYLNHGKLTPSKLPAAYDDFVVLLSEFLDNDHIRHLRRLNYTKIELSYLKQMCDVMIDGRHVLYDVFINKSLALLETEIQLIKNLFLDNQMQYPFLVEKLQGHGNGKKNFSLTWNGTDNDLIELVAALMAAGTIGSTGGRKVNVVDLINVFEEAFHIRIKALYTKRGKVFDRCSNSTPFLDSLRNSYNRMIQERLA